MKWIVIGVFENCSAYSFSKLLPDACNLSFACSTDINSSRSFGGSECIKIGKELSLSYMVRKGE